MDRIEADVLIPGRGEPVRNGCVVLEGTTVAYAGPVEDAPSTPDTRTYSVPAVMPGMWDCHGHFMGLRRADPEDVIRTPLPLLGARVTADAQRALRAGFTSVREPGGLGLELGRAIDEGSVPGPHVHAAGSFLSQTGGHGDIHAFPLDVVHRLARAGGYLQVCDGVPECLRAVRLQLRRGARLIKVHASGGVVSEVDHPVHQQFSDEELGAIVREAARAERVVAAHCHGKPGILAALRAGCRTIEHGSFLDEEAADLLLEKGAILVPTRFIMEALLAHAEEASLPEYARRKMEAVAEAHREALRLAVKKGVPIAVGTDIFLSGEGAVPWGRNGEELVHLAEAGMKPLAVLEAATARGPETLGPQAPRSGQLRAGYDADLIAVTEDPTRDVGVLADPANVSHVWKGGRLVKGS